MYVTYTINILVEHIRNLYDYGAKKNSSASVGRLVYNFITQGILKEMTNLFLKVKVLYKKYFFPSLESLMILFMSRHFYLSNLRNCSKFHYLYISKTICKKVILARYIKFDEQCNYCNGNKYSAVKE